MPDTKDVHVTLTRGNGSGMQFELQTVASAEALWAGIDIWMMQKGVVLQDFTRMQLQIKDTPVKL